MWKHFLRGNGFKLKDGNFRSDVRRKFYTRRIARPWHRWLRAALGALYLEVLKARSDRALSNRSGGRCPSQGRGWNWMIFTVFSTQAILWLYKSLGLFHFRVTYDGHLSTLGRAVRHVCVSFIYTFIHKKKKNPFCLFFFFCHADSAGIEITKKRKRKVLVLLERVSRSVCLCTVQISGGSA